MRAASGFDDEGTSVMTVLQRETSPGTAALTRKVLAFVNPNSGSCLAEIVRETLTRVLNEQGIEVEIREPTEDPKALSALIQTAESEGIGWVVAAGGDGTVSAVADALAGRNLPLGVIPLGTANVLARELGIPVDLDGAVALLIGPNRVRVIDALKVNGRHYLTQLGVGLDALMIRDTKTEHKRRFGRLAYLWTASRSLVGFQPCRFDLTLDGRTVRVNASQIVVANTGMMGQPPLRWGPDIEPDDGTVDVCVVRARTLTHYLSLVWSVLTGRQKMNRNVRYFHAKHHLEIKTKHPHLTQADGEIIGETPIRIDVVAGAIGVIVPVMTETAAPPTGPP